VAGIKPQQLGSISHHLALRERFYDLAEQRARQGKGVGCAGVGAVPIDDLRC